MGGVEGGASIVADVGERYWWRRTSLLAITAVTAGGLASLLVLVLAPALDIGSVLGIPFGLLGVTVIVPLFVLVVIFWAAERQRRIDRAHGFFEG